MEELKFAGFPLNVFVDKLDQMSERRLITLKKAFENRWGLENLEASKTKNLTKPDRNLFVERTAYYHIKLAISKFEKDRKHLENPIHIRHEPTGLKRGVSWREFEDIAKIREVVGKKNSWHTHDTRKVVFWCSQDISDETVLFQANDLCRQAIICLCEERGLEIKADSISGRELKNWRLREAKRRADADWTTAVLFTKPIENSIVWPRHNKENMMGTVDEYGLPSGRVKAEDICLVRIYKEYGMIKEGGFNEMVDYVANLKSPKADHIEMASLQEKRML